MSIKAGMMSDVDIREAIKNNEICIAPFDLNDSNDRRLTPAGFNFSFSDFIVSLNQKTFYKIHKRGNEKFFMIEPGDTAIALTEESIWVSKGIGGTFHSKVGYVSQGLGHISTTLDPQWQGQLLISVNNPNRKKIKVNIARFERGEWIYSTFITLCLFRLITPTRTESDNHASRLDTLCEIILDGKWTPKQNKLVECIQKMLTIMTSQNAIKLSDLDVVDRSHIETFAKDHKELLAKWKGIYDDEIEKVNEVILIRKKIFSYIPLIASIVVVSSIIFGVWKWSPSHLANLSIPLFSATLAYIVAWATAKKKK